MTADNAEIGSSRRVRRVVVWFRICPQQQVFTECSLICSPNPTSRAAAHDSLLLSAGSVFHVHEKRKVK
jgi:hypothetical protein